MTERFLVDDAGTLIDMHTRNTYDYVSDVVTLLNELHEENQRLKLQKSFERKTLLEIFDEMCIKYDETGRNEDIIYLFKAKHPVTNETMELKIELLE